MDAIPDDIRAAALAVVDRGYDEGLVEAVAKAILAERERCAKIADREAELAQALYDAVEKWDVGQFSDRKIEAQLLRKLAAAIRGEPHHG